MSWRCFDGLWKVSRCPDGVWKVFWGYLEGVGKMSGGCLEGVWRYLEVVWKVFGACLEGVWNVFRRCPDVGWKASGGKAFGRSLENFCMERVWKVSRRSLGSTYIILWVMEILELFWDSTNTFCQTPLQTCESNSAWVEWSRSMQGCKDASI